LPFCLVVALLATSVVVDSVNGNSTPVGHGSQKMPGARPAR
jgi:hypothetical protein